MKVLCLVFLSLFTAINSQSSSLSFTDMFQASGLTRGSPDRSLKFGGPCVADLDSDGIYDIILTFHNRNLTRIYMGLGDFKYEVFRNPATGFNFRPKILDVHGVAVSQVSAKSTNRIISLNVGGGRGANPRSAEIYEMTSERGFTDVTNGRGFGAMAGRPRNTVFMDMQFNKKNGARRRDGGGPDALFVNFLIPPLNLTQFAYNNIRGQYSLVTDLGAFNAERRGRVEVTDRNDDGKMEIISIQELKMYQLDGPFSFVDITSTVFAGLNIGRFTVTAVAEIDFDNDGDMDLYVARADRTLVTRLPPINDGNTDLLLKNTGGLYENVAASANLPEGGNSIGVTAGDFDNDGYVDLLIVQHSEADYILLNNQDGTFRRVDGLIPKQTGDIGDNAVGVDLDRDGRLDAIVGHGGVGGGNFGPYLLMKNMMTLDAGTNWLRVTVYNDRTRASTGLHAIVKLFMPRRKRMVRRIGSVGAQLGGGSYLDTVHFGLGGAASVNRVMVRWTSRVQENMRNVKTNTHITFGVQ